MEFKKPKKTQGGFLFKLFLAIVSQRGLDSNLVRVVALKKISLREKNFITLKRLLSSSEITFKSFIWLLAVFLDVKEITINIRTKDKDGEVNDVTLTTAIERDDEEEDIT